MLRRLLFIAPLLLVVTVAEAKVKLHPTGSVIFAVTPHTAVTQNQYDTDYYTDIGGSVDFSFDGKFTLSPGYRFGFDTLNKSFDTYSSPSLTFGINLSKIVEERFKVTGLFANTGGYQSGLFGIGTHIIPNSHIELEVTPQFFVDSIDTKQLEVDLDVDINITQRWHLNTDVTVGRTYVSHVENLTSYALGGGATLKLAGGWKAFGFVAFAHGLNTDTPYSIINSTSTVNTQTGARPFGFGNTALDPNGNTINISIGTSLDF